MIPDPRPDSGGAVALDLLGQPQGIYLHFEGLRGEITKMLEHDALSKEAIRRLEADLNVYKRAYEGLQADHLRDQKVKLEVEKQNAELEQKLKGHRIIILIDGDGAIFDTSLVTQGHVGGHLAAQKLSDAVLQYLNSSHGIHPYQLCVYIFLNKRGLSDAYSRFGFPQAKAKFEDFMIGFNQATERFMMVDVGGAKEAADAKIKALLEDEIKLPQTEKIIFGGCHDNGYVTTLRSQITAGYQHKLIMLPSYADTAAGIAELELPCISISDLFLAHKLGNSGIPSRQGSFSGPAMKSEEGVGLRIKTSDFFEQALEALPFSAVEPEGGSTKTTSWSTIAKRAITPDLDSGGSTASSDSFCDDTKTRPGPTTRKLRRVNPNIPLSKHKPPPCTLFYLSNCKHGAECKYAHDYVLEVSHYEEIRTNAKKSPCPARNKGEKCVWGDECCYGHVCPAAGKCHFLKQGRCKFVGGDMHRA